MSIVPCITLPSLLGLLPPRAVRPELAESSAGIQQGRRAPRLPPPPPLRSLHPGWQHPVTNSSRLDFSKGGPTLNLADSALCGSSHPCQLESLQKPIIISPRKEQLGYSPPLLLQAGMYCAFPQTEIPLVGSITAIGLHALFNGASPSDSVRPPRWGQK